MQNVASPLGYGERSALLTGVLRVFCAQEVFSVPSFVRDHVVLVQPVTYLEDEPCDSDVLCSWLAVDAVWVTLFKVGEKNTCMYVHETEAAYVVRELASLHADCPSGTAFIGQIVLDATQDGGVRPMVMVFDILSVGGNPPQSMAALPPVQRYAILREGKTAAWLSSPGLAIHWAGFRNAATAFCCDPRQTARVPHKIQSVFQYDCNKPGMLWEIPLREAWI